MNPQACYRVIQTRDRRFDGRLFVGVTSTGIYCRPICAARTPKLENCQFFLSAAAAQEAGFRPCLRCRPETAPEFAAWRGTSNTVSRALELIAIGTLDDGEVNLGALAERVGVGERQLRRLFQQHLGATPLAVARTRRVLFAKQLIQGTRMPMGQIALAAGFGSVRCFNEVFRRLFARPPSALRKNLNQKIGDLGTTVELHYRPPYDWGCILAFLQARAIEGIELVEGGVYTRTIAIDGCSGTIAVKHMAARSSLGITLNFLHLKVLSEVIGRIRRVFDTGADIERISSHLARDRFLAPLIAKRPGLRLPGGWDPFELAVRAILGQQITVQGARRLAAILVERCGETLGRGVQGDPRLSRVFPSAERLAATDLDNLPMPAARRATLKALAHAAVETDLFKTFDTVEQTMARLRNIRGVGEWTAQYIALRAMRETDAFPAADVALLRSAGLLLGARPTPDQLLQQAEPWRPWRAYAAQHLWAAM
jgi:AraC family transcriptional regulator of adaptative response / DNA-3-methyladenine glycosylase II